MTKTKKKHLWIKLIFGSALFAFITWKVYSTFTAKANFPQDLNAVLLHEYFILLIVLVILLMPLNWLLESVKWHVILKEVGPKPFKHAVKAVLAGISTSLLTPNRIGNFIGRSLLLEKEKRTRAVLATIHANIAQFVASTTFGFAGLMMVGFENKFIDESTLRISAFIILFVGLAFYFFPRIIDFDPLNRLFSERMKKALNVLQGESFKLKSTVLLLSLLRYVVFLVQFYVLLIAFGSINDPFFLIPAIALVYLVTTVVPSFLFGKLFVREASALFILSAFGIHSVAILATVFILWMLNLAIPAIIGAIILMRIK